MKKNFIKSLLVASTIIATSSCAQLSGVKSKIFKSDKNSCPAKKIEKHNCTKDSCSKNHCKSKRNNK